MKEAIKTVLSEKEIKEIEKGQIEFVSRQEPVPPSPNDVVKYLRGTKKKLVVVTPKRMYRVEDKGTKDKKTFARRLAKKLKENYPELTKKKTYRKGSPEARKWLRMINESDSLQLETRTTTIVVYNGKEYRHPEVDTQGNIVLGGKIKNKKVSSRKNHRIVMDGRIYKRLGNQWTGASEENAGVLLGYLDTEKSRIKGLKGLNLPEMKDGKKGLEHLLSSAIGGTGGTLAHEKVFNYFRKRRDRIGTYHSHPTKDKAHWNDKDEWKKLAEKGNARVHVVLLGDSIVPGRSDYGGMMPYYISENGEVEKAYIEVVNTRKHL